MTPQIEQLSKSDHIKYEVPLKVKQSDRYEIILIKVCLMASTPKIMQLMKLFGYNEDRKQRCRKAGATRERWKWSKVRMRVRMDGTHV